MVTLYFGQWRFSCDPEATRLGHGTRTGFPEACGCTACRNFIALRQQVYPAALLRLLAQAGVPPNGESHVYYVAPLGAEGTDQSLHLYEGWFHFVGEVLRAPPVPARGAVWQHGYQRMGNAFALWFASSAALAPAGLHERQLVEIQFRAALPWILPSPAPGTAGQPCPD